MSLAARKAFEEIEGIELATRDHCQTNNFNFMATKWELLLRRAHLSNVFDRCHLHS